MRNKRAQNLSSGGFGQQKKTDAKGTIIKGISGFYYVAVEAASDAAPRADLPANLAPREGMRIYQCRARGIFRKEKKKPLVGDRVRIEILDEEAAEANLTDILPRKNELIRPAVANIDQALIVVAAARPAFHTGLLDRFLLWMERQGIPVTICFNKEDLGTEEELPKKIEVFADAGLPDLADLFLSAAGLWNARNRAVWQVSLSKVRQEPPRKCCQPFHFSIL